MIKLEIERYCEDCLEFKPCTEKVTRYDGSGEKQCDTYIYCKHEGKCRGIMKHLRRVKDAN